jgi:uncharacterized phage-like protein YoqJ
MKIYRIRNGKGDFNFMSIIGISGRRPQSTFGFKTPNPMFNYICRETEKKFIELEPEKIITGLALGYDQICGRIALKLDIPFIAAVPFKGQDAIWGNEEKQIYNMLLEKAYDVVYVCDGGYAAWKLQKRNEFIVDNCDIMLACIQKDCKSGGTFNCLEYAKTFDKKIIKIFPENYNIKTVE